LKIKCLLIDDEFLARQLLEGHIQKVPYLELVGSCERAAEGLAVLQSQQVDLILLDVNMPELSGLNFLKVLQDKPEVILTTAYSEHAIEAYQLDVIEYLLKPIYFERFLQAVEKAKKQIELKRRHTVATDSLENESFFIKTGPQKITKVNVADVIYIESLHEYVRIHLQAESFIIYHSLKGILETLPPDRFVQIHRSHIINFTHVKSIEGNMVTVGPFELNIGKNYRDTLMEKIKLKSIGSGTQK